MIWHTLRGQKYEQNNSMSYTIKKSGEESKGNISVNLSTAANSLASTETGVDVHHYFAVDLIERKNFDLTLVPCLC